MKETDKIVELICQRGCKSVNSVRTQLQNGETVIELAAFSSKDRMKIKRELDSIMSVYENKKKFSVG